MYLDWEAREIVYIYTIWPRSNKKVVISLLLLKFKYALQC